MPEIPFYNGGLPPQSGPVPQMPLNNLGVPKANLGGLQQQEGQTGNVAASADLANQAPEANKNFFAGQEQGVQNLGTGLENAGANLIAVAEKKQLSLNVIALQKATDQFREATEQFDSEKMQLDPQTWPRELQKRYQAVQANLEGNENISPAAAQEIHHFASRYTSSNILNQTTASNLRIFQDAGVAAQQNAYDLAKDGDIHEARLAAGIAHTQGFHGERQLVDTLNGINQIGEKAYREQLDAYLKTQKWDDARKLISDNANDLKVITPSQAFLDGTTVKLAERDDVISKKIVADPRAALADLTEKNGIDQFVHDPDMPIGRREQFVGMAGKYIAENQHANFNNVVSLIDQGNKIDPAKVNDMDLSPQQKFHLQKYIQGAIPKNTNAAWNDIYGAIQGYMPQANPADDAKSRATILEAIDTHFDGAFKTELNQQAQKAFTETPSVQKTSLHDIIEASKQHMVDGRFGDVTLRTPEGNMVMKPQERPGEYVIPNTVDTSHWWAPLSWYTSRPGNVDDAVKIAKDAKPSLVPAIDKVSPQWESAEAKRKTVITSLQDWIQKNPNSSQQEIWKRYHDLTGTDAQASEAASMMPNAAPGAIPAMPAPNGNGPGGINPALFQFGNDIDTLNHARPSKP